MKDIFMPYIPDNITEGVYELFKTKTLTYGKYGKAFEDSLRKFVGTSNILTVNSYNSASILALHLMELKAGDEIIASPMSCLASNMPLLTVKAKIVWGDIDPQPGTLSPESVLWLCEIRQKD